MTRKEIIEHWMLIVNSVFAAEHNIIDKWKPKLEKAKHSSGDEVLKIKDAYLHAVAVEIVNNTPEQELLKLYNEK